MAQAFHNQTVPGQQEHDAKLFFIYVGIAIVVFGVWASIYLLKFRPSQVVEIFAIFCASVYQVYETVKYFIERKSRLEKQWPKPQLMISETVDRRNIAKAVKMNATLMGYDNDRKPVFLTDAQRAMQSNLPGMSGTGKTTTIMNIVEQDIWRGHPIIIVDGKGEKGDFVLRIVEMASAAGRGADVRVIDPSHPAISAKYNPFFSPKGNTEQRVGMVFDSLGAAQSKDEFFAEHQRAFLDSVVNVLRYTGKTLSFPSVYAGCQQQDIIGKVINDVRESVRNNPDIPQYEKDAFELNAAALNKIFEDDDWVTKVQGLLNSMKPFVGSALSQIMAATERPVTLEEVIEKRQILIVSLNAGTDSQATRALGRIILRDLQTVIASRYEGYERDKKHSFVSVILDEFGLYAYPGFSSIIHTARQANAAFLFSFQSVKQLEDLVGHAFAHDVATATNNKFLMRISEEDTASSFIQASAAVRTEKFTYQMEKPSMLDGNDYEESGRASRTETLETRVKDYEVKNLPNGQMMALMTDPAVGVVLKHIHVRQAPRYYLPLKPIWLDAFARTEAEDDSLRVSISGDYEQKETKRGERRKRRK